MRWRVDVVIVVVGCRPKEASANRELAHIKICGQAETDGRRGSYETFIPH